MITLEQLCGGAAAAPFEWARTAARAGQRVIGYVGADVPVELILAAGAFPFRLPAVPQPSTAAADLYFEAGFLPAHRAMAEQWLQGKFDFIDQVVFSRGDDSSQRVYYYLCELQRTGRAQGPRALLFDVARIPRPSSHAYTLDATRKLAATLDARESELPQAIASMNRLRDGLARVQTLRRGSVPPPGDLWARLQRTVGLVPTNTLCESLEAWTPDPRSSCQGPRLLMAGSSPPDERLHLAVSDAGGCVTGEYGEDSVDSTLIAATLEAVASRAHSSTSGPRSFHDVASGLASEVDACRADGVILWLVEEEESWTWEVPRIREQLSAKGTPFLSLPRSRWGEAGGVAAAISKFVATLRGHT